jgi:glycosyltransferase involved in cell wall biosynthesis
MKVLWFTNDPMPAVNRRAGRENAGTGHWMPSLLESLVHAPGIELEVATIYPGLSDDQFREDGVDYVAVGSSKRAGAFFHCSKRDLDAACRVVRESAPDLIHIHGTERFYGLLPARRLTDVPCVISLQGLLSAYYPLFFGGLTPRELWQASRLIEVATQRGLLWLHHEYARGARREKEILAGAPAFLGRTDWDYAHVRTANRTAAYHHVGEILRRPFREKQWNLAGCKRATILYTKVGEPYRGPDVILRAVQLVRQRIPEVRLRLAGELGARRGYDRFLRRRIVESGLSDCVDFLGYLNAGEMAAELSRAHVFALSSYIENSPNSLCEAMQVGVPCVASYVGGIPSLVKDGRTGLLFPPGDAPLLAAAMLRIFEDDELAHRLGSAARAVALHRHAPGQVTRQLLTAYHAAAGGRCLQDEPACSLNTTV